VTVPPMADWLESFVPMRLHALIRFGPLAGDHRHARCPPIRCCYCVTHRADPTYAQGVACAALGRLARRRAAPR